MNGFLSFFYISLQRFHFFYESFSFCSFKHLLHYQTWIIRWKENCLRKSNFLCLWSIHTEQQRRERKKNFFLFHWIFSFDERKERVIFQTSVELSRWKTTEEHKFAFSLNISWTFFFLLLFFNVTLLEMTPILFFSPAGYARPIINNVSTSSWSATDYFLTSSIDDPCMWSFTKFTFNMRCWGRAEMETWFISRYQCLPLNKDFS